MHSKKFGYIAIGIFLFAVGVFFSALYLQIQTKKKIYKHGLSTVGVLFDVKGDYIKVKYTVDGDTLTFGTTRPYRHLQNGEEYIVKYMEEDPEYISVLYSQPFFPILINMELLIAAR